MHSRHKMVAPSVALSQPPPHVFIFFIFLFFLCALNTSIYRLINDVGPKIKADDVVTMHTYFIVFFATLLFYVVT